MSSRRRQAAARLARAAGLAIVLLAALPVIVGPWLDRAAGYLVTAHSELVASSPGAGAVVATVPGELRLVFSEPVDPGYTSLDVLDSNGVAVLSSLGLPDPTDARVLVAAIPAGSLASSGLFTVSWRTLSAADGHVERGFFTFGVGDVAPAAAAAADAGGSGGLHSGHSAGIVVVEVPGKFLGYSGSMLAVGLAILGFVALRPAARNQTGGGAGDEPVGPVEPVAEPVAAPGTRRRGGRERRPNGPSGRAMAAARVAPPAPSRGTPPPAASPRRRQRILERPPIALAVVFGAAPRAAGWALLAGAAGCAILLAIAVATVVGSAGPAGIVSFVTGTRSGILLMGRIVLGAVGGIAVLALRRSWGTEGAGLALGLAGGVGLGGLMLTAAGSHAAAFVSPLPMAVDVIHLVATSIWLSGLALLAALTDFGRASRLAPGAIRLVIPRFSALALVSVAVIALTGAYADWTLTRDPLSAASPYQLSLVVKIAVFAAALGLGAVNFLDGGEDRRWLGGLSRRLTAELLAGLAVLALASNLTSGSPTALDRPVVIEPAASTAASGATLSMDLLPGRVGPNRFAVDVPAAGSGVVVELVLQRLDADEGLSRVTMRSEPGAPATRLVADASLAEGSRWDATVVASSATGEEIARQRFVFGLDADGVSEGRAVPPVDPALLLAVLLLGLGIVGLAFGLAGGVLPRTLPDASRPALVGASTVGALLGLAIMLIAGPR